MQSVSKCYTLISYKAVGCVYIQKSAVYLSVYRVRFNYKIQGLRSMTKGQKENQSVRVCIQAVILKLVRSGTYSCQYGLDYCVFYRRSSKCLLSVPGVLAIGALPAFLQRDWLHTWLTMYICRPFQYDCTSRWPYEFVLVALRSVVVSLRCVLVTMARF